MTIPQPRPRTRLPDFLAVLLERDPYLGAQAVVASTIVLDLALPERLTLGPTWVAPAFEGGLLVALIMLTPHPGLRKSALRRRMALGVIGLVSFVNLVSLGLLVHFLLNHDKSKAHPLILAGVVLWVTNVLLFGLWYWELDRGGPVDRASAVAASPDFLFPQMSEPQHAAPDWTPNLVDYLYVSLTNASAFSPTDTMPLSRTAKVLMSTQSVASLVTVGLVVARAVNVL